MKAFRFKKSVKPTGFTLVEIMIVVLIIGILLAIAIPNFVQAREASRAKACVANLKQMDSAKQQYMMDNNVSTFAAVTPVTQASNGGLSPKYMKSVPNCPAGGTYTTGTEAVPPSCTAGTNGTITVNGNSYYHVLP